MKIVLVGPRYANAPHGAEVGIHNALVNMGIETLVIDPRKFPEPDNLVVDKISVFDPDFILVPGCTPPYKFLYSLCKTVPLINWNSEEIRLSEYNERIEKYHVLYHWIFHFDDSAIPIYNYMGIKNVSWLPQAFDPIRHYCTGELKEVFEVPFKRSKHVQFIGSMGGKHFNRTYLMQFLVSNGIKVKYVSSYDPLVNSELYSNAACSINLGLDVGHFTPSSFRAYGFQQRVFESFGSNCPVFTPIPENYPAYNNRQGLIDGSNIILYNKDNLIDKLSKYLSDDKLIETCSNETRAWKHIHTYQARIEEMVDKLNKEGIINATI